MEMDHLYGLLHVCLSTYKVINVASLWVETKPDLNQTSLQSQYLLLICWEHDVILRNGDGPFIWCTESPPHWLGT